MRRLPALIAMAAALMWGCAEEETAPPVPTDGNVTPTMITDSVNSFISDSGITRYHLVTPLWLMFDEADDPFWHFPQGLDLEQFDDRLHTQATVTADTARYFSRRKLWKLDGNVRMRNISGDKFLTQQLFWDQKAHKVYSDSFIHIERAGRILEGYGFTSNEEITAYTIRRPTGIFPTEGFEHRRDTAPPASAAAVQPMAPAKRSE